MYGISAFLFDDTDCIFIKQFGLFCKYNSYKIQQAENPHNFNYPAGYIYTLVSKYIF